MSIRGIVDALSLPPDAVIEKRVPKKLMAEQGAPTAADRRQIQDGIEELNWIAALKPTNIGVPEYRDTEREYIEIAVIAVSLRPAAKLTRLLELVHRAIPYPVALIAEQEGAFSLSFAHKRFSQAENDKMVIEELQKTDPMRMDELSQGEHAFLGSIALAGLPRSNLFALYQGWIDRVAALQAASITGDFAPPESPERAEEILAVLESHERLQREITALRAQAGREKQLNRRVDLNLQIKRLEAELVGIEELLSKGGR